MGTWEDLGEEEWVVWEACQAWEVCQAWVVCLVWEECLVWVVCHLEWIWKHWQAWQAGQVWRTSTTIQMMRIFLTWNSQSEENIPNYLTSILVSVAFISNILLYHFGSICSTFNSFL